MVVSLDIHSLRDIKSFNIPVLYIVKTAQNQHGLRHGDYQRYQQYVTRKLRRMRKSLRFQQGTRSRVTPKKLTPELINDERFLILAVFEIERSWAFAMQLKAEANSDPRKRFHMISRLRKANKRALTLADLILDAPFCDAQTKLELTAYIRWVCGILHFELQDWAQAKELLETSQNIYSGLATSVDEDLKSIYTSRISELLPQIRYCSYSIGDESAASELREMRNFAATDGSNLLAEYQLDDLLKQVQVMQATSVTEVEWLGLKIPVKLEKARLAILSVQESDNELSKTSTSQKKVAICESTLKILSEAIASQRDEIRAVSSEMSTSGQTSNQLKKFTPGFDKLPRLQFLYAYLQYLKLNKSIWRTLYQVEGLMCSVTNECRDASMKILTSAYHKPQEVARLYDTVVQNLQEVLHLPGIIQENEGVKSLLRGCISGYKSLRCYYLALAYLHGKKFIESSSLLTRCQTQAHEAITCISTEHLDIAAVAEAVPGYGHADLLAILQSLLKQTDAEILICKAGYMLNLAGGDSEEPVIPESVLNAPLINCLDEFLPEKVMLNKLSSMPSPLVPFPPEFEPVPVKPTFFDLALNHISFPTQPKISTADGSSGITGFMRGLIWGSGSQQQN